MEGTCLCKRDPVYEPDRENLPRSSAMLSSFAVRPTFAPDRPHQPRSSVSNLRGFCPARGLPAPGGCSANRALCCSPQDRSGHRGALCARGAPHRRKVPRSATVALISLAVLLALGVGGCLLFPTLEKQASQLVSSLPNAPGRQSSGRRNWRVAWGSGGRRGRRPPGPGECRTQTARRSPRCLWQLVVS